LSCVYLMGGAHGRAGRGAESQPCLEPELMHGAGQWLRMRLPSLYPHPL